VLAVSRDEPTQYRLFKRADELDQSRYEPTGMAHADYHNAAQFATFVDALRTPRPHQPATPDETDTGSAVGRGPFAISTGSTPREFADPWPRLILLDASPLGGGFQAPQ